MCAMNLRQKTRISYYEPEEPNLDEYVFCDKCGDFVYEYCSIHGPLLVIPDDKIYDRNNKPCHVVDAVDANNSNWMRYVNCSRDWFEQNLVAYQYRGQLYYRTIKIIPRFTELMVFYGSEYAHILHIDLQRYNAPAGYAQKLGAPPTKKVKLDENHNIKQGDVNSIKSGKKENIFETETNTTADSNNLSRIVNDEKCKQVLSKKPFICNDCGKTCETKAVLIKHIIGHKPVTIEVNEANITNPKSSREKKYKSKIKENDSSNKNLPYKCKYCNYTSSRTGNLKIHIRTHTGEKPFKCQYCSYTCTQNSSLKIHIRTHTGEKPFKCQYCSYTCTVNSSLKSHIRTHTGEKPFKCQYCSYTCTVNSNLKIHIRTHTGEKPFKCQYCSYKCTVNSHLKDHIRTHTSEKPFKCQYCSYTCTLNSSLKSHIRTHTGEKPYKCEICDKKFRERIALNKHLQVHMDNKSQ